MSLDNKDLSLFCVYMHTNQINNKRYVGITNQKPSYRWRTDGSGYKHQMFGRAIDKYGWENFSHELLAIDVSKEEACKFEQKYIEKYKTTNPKFGYNLSLGGEAGAFGVYNRGASRPVYQYDLQGNYIKEWPSMDEVERQLGILSSNVQACTVGKTKSSGGYQWSRQKYEKMGVVDESLMQKLKHDKSIKIYKYSMEDGSFVGRFCSMWEASDSIDTSGKKISGVRVHILDCLEKRQFSAYGYRWFYEYQGETVSIKQISPKCKRVHQYSLNGEYITSYNSSIEAAAAVNGSYTKIGACCRGARKSSAGYMWSFDLIEDGIEQYSSSVDVALRRKGVKKVYQKKGTDHKKKVSQFDKDWNLIKTYNSILEATRSVGGKSQYMITKCCQGKKEFAFKYRWKYVEH